MTTSPMPIRTPGAWRGPEIDFVREGLHVLSPAEIAEIDAALRHLRGLGDLDFPEITPEAFPLDGLGRYLAGLQDTLRFGRGFVMLRGIPRDDYDADDMARIYFGLGSYIGLPITQSYQGELLGHVIDVSDVEAKPRAYHAGGRIEMHTDSSDVVALMCMRSARSGGLSRISSALAAHNAILASRPDLAEVLYRGFYYRRTDEDGRHATGALSRYRIETFARTASERGDEVSCYFLGGYARRAERSGEVAMTPIEHEAIEEMEALAASAEYYLDMSFADGDIQFLNNRTILHGRTDYEDDRDVYHRRHLLRLWLRVPSWPALPEHQVFHTAEDLAMWARARCPLMELPSVYLDSLARHLAAAS